MVTGTLYVAALSAKIVSLLKIQKKMISLLSTPGQWYLDYLENGLFSALESMGILWPLVISLVIILGVLALAFFVPYPGAVE
jgi:hypothetical protein